MRSRAGVLGFFKVGGLFFMALAGFIIFVGGSSEGAVITAGTFGFIGFIWYLVAVGVGGWYKRSADKQAADRQLFQIGQKATGVIERVEPSATSINDMPVVYVTVNVTPKYGRPFTHTEKIVTPASAIPAPGQLIEVAYDPNDPSRVALDTAAGFMGPPGVILRTRPGDPAAVPSDATAAAAVPASSESSSDDPLDRLERLAKLHKAGVLTDAEFADEKARLLKGR